MKLQLERGHANEREWVIGDIELTIGRDSSCDILLQDPTVPAMQARVYRVGVDVIIENMDGEKSMRLEGEYLAPWNPAPLSVGARLEIGNTLLTAASSEEPSRSELVPPAPPPADAASRPLHPDRLAVIGEVCEVILRLGNRQAFFEKILDAIFNTLDVRRAVILLLTGETGVGKDVIANAIHLGSPRREGPFIPVNCGAIPDSLLDSELFGHEKGAFTGALSRKRGRFERANGGTILLDEIGEMPLEAQVRLLRVLQHREIERLGGTDRIPVDIRVITATNKDLEAQVAAGRFREDLWFRLNVFPIVVPPLRDRSSDIPALLDHFIERKAAELKVGDTPHLAPGAIDVLMAYQWPGNVRELENVVERAMILHRGEPLRFDDLGTSLRRTTTGPQPGPGQQSLALEEVTAQHIRKVLGIVGGKIHGPGGAGELLGVNPNTLRYKMKKLGIPFRKDRESA